ncbi:MAG: TM0106 family RecB-like putative nuclease, partial [Maritimibacter sp.]|nr:TM0106 family RecB-like putative nuclease [Maritimibacter sp.]
MIKTESGYQLSASDLMRFTTCRHATQLDIARLAGEGPERAEDSDDAALLQRYGDAHEAAHLAGLRDRGLKVIEIRDLEFDEALVATGEALASGADVIFQGALAGGEGAVRWGGWSDFLERVDRPSDLGPFSYEVADTKLKKKPVPGHVLQLVLYSDLLAPLQGLVPERAHVELGNGERFSFRLGEYSAYARAARRRLEAFVQAPDETRPVPVAGCALCRWRDHCAERWQDEDSLFLVAGVSRTQVSKLEAAGIKTMEALARLTEPVAGMATSTREKLTVQARLQHARRTGTPDYELREVEPGRGFTLMPPPSPGDLYYDIEGDPFYREGRVEGLEYLHGVWDGTNFTPFWAHDHAEERRALEALFEMFDARLGADPGAHIYHYAAYEITALRRLCARHGFGETMLDRWLRERRFVDLFAVVRGGLIASEKSYSIKEMEAFLNVTREGEVKTAGGSVVAYEEWRESGDDHILQEIEDYNEVDCVSTEKLRHWLVTIRPDIPWREVGESQEDKQVEEDAEEQALRARLAASDLAPYRQQLLFDLAQFHAREAKPSAWSVFDAAASDTETLIDNTDTLAGLRALGPSRPEKRSTARDYSFPPQETKLRVGGKAQIALEDGFATVDVIALDRLDRHVTLKLGPKWGKALPDRTDLLPNFAIDARIIQGAIAAVIDDQCGPRDFRATDDLLSGTPPRFRGPSPLGLHDDPVKAVTEAVKALDNSVLPVQGPPGTGKTYVTARAILALVRAGKRVGVASNSHAAIVNVLMGCIGALDPDDPDLTVEMLDVVYKAGSGPDPLMPESHAIQVVTKPDDPAIGSARILGGTAWQFARDDLVGAFDYLFVDEAGQVSLANLVGMSRAARNLVLVGDPRQLPQVIQGTHPWPANLSALEWLLGDHTTIPADRGVFLGTTRRMHPDLCGYISNQFYDHRLEAHPDTAKQRVDAQGMP